MSRIFGGRVATVAASVAVAAAPVPAGRHGSGIAPNSDAQHAITVCCAADSDRDRGTGRH